MQKRSNEVRMTPDYLFEVSWEVCNKVGGIHTVIATKALTITEQLGDRYILIGPDVHREDVNLEFEEDSELLKDWKQALFTNDNIRVKIGHWKVKGSPIAILVDFSQFFSSKDDVLKFLWESYRVDSISGQWDYIEPVLFGSAAGKVIESYVNFFCKATDRVTAHFHEWMTSSGGLYLQKHSPYVASVFTTHATVMGRSIAGNGMPLYGDMPRLNADDLARRFGVVAKHSLEKTAAANYDCFTTVSNLTAKECKYLLGKEVDLVTPNGFEPNFVPTDKEYDKKRTAARRDLLNVAEKLLGCPISPDAFLVSTSGRYEYRNKGIDVFIEAMNRVRTSGRLQREVVAFIMVPAWVRDARADLKEVIDKNIRTTSPMQMPFVTHWLNQMEQDKVLNYISHAGFTNSATDKLKIIFVPCYLDGRDGILNKPYYDLLIGMDATVYPSYYEPWGYTPLESIAFGIPTITTDLAGFGLWAKKHVTGNNISEGVAVVNRDDFNYFEVADAITSSILALAGKDKKETAEIRKRSFCLAAKAEWSKFIVYYEEAFRIALEHASKRNN